MTKSSIPSSLIRNDYFSVRLWLLQWNYRIVGNFRGRNFREFRGFVAICQSFLRKIWRCGVFWYGKSEQSVKFFSVKIMFYTNSWKFSFESFLLHGIASFLGLPTIQFLIAYNMPRLRRKSWLIYYVNDVNVYLSRQRREGYIVQPKEHIFFVPNKKFSALKLQRLDRHCIKKTSKYI